MPAHDRWRDSRAVTVSMAKWKDVRLASRRRGFSFLYPWSSHTGHNISSIETILPDALHFTGLVLGLVGPVSVHCGLSNELNAQHLWVWQHVKFFFFFCVPSYISGVHHFLSEIFAYVTVFFFNPTIEVVTLRLRGWCILGVFLLPAFTRLGHECQDLLSPCEGMHVCTD